MGDCRRYNYHDYNMQILTDEKLPVGNIEKLADCSDFHAKSVKNVLSVLDGINHR